MSDMSHRFIQFRVPQGTACLITEVFGKSKNREVVSRSLSFAQHFVDNVSAPQANLTLWEAQYLKDVLLHYANHEAQEGDFWGRRAKRLAEVLDDHIITYQGQAQEDKTGLLEPLERNEAAEEAQRSLEKANQLRDQMLSEVFLGGPRKSLNIWGEVIEESNLGSKENFRSQAKVINFFTPSWQSSQGGPLEIQDRLVGPEYIFLNRQVRKARMSSFSGEGAVVSTVSSFLKKVKESLDEDS